MPTATFTQRAATAIPSELVWLQLQEPETWKAMGGIESIEQPRFDDAGLLTGFEFTTMIGGQHYRGTATTVSSVPRREMIVDIDTADLVARLDVGLSESDNPGTTLDVEMTLTSKSFLASMMWGLISSTVGSGLSDRVTQMVTSLR